MVLVTGIHCTVETGFFAPLDARKKGQKNPEAKNGEKYIESKHSCMVNGAKKPDRQKNPEAKKI